jgi:anti-sigma factor RsiW
MKHPNTDTLLGYLEGDLSPGARASVESHLPCTRCHQELRQLSCLLDSFTVPVAEPSTSVVSKVFAAFSTSQWKKPSLRQRFVALLQFDSRLTPVAMGARGATGPAQLLFVADDIDFDLQLISGASASLLGQALPHDNNLNRVAGQSVRLLQNEQMQAETHTDEMGQFEFHQVVPGTYDVVIGVEEDHEVALPGVKF